MSTAVQAFLNQPTSEPGEEVIYGQYKGEFSEGS